ncbi:MAG: tetratricopeptide repeat protein [Xanthobacteraceae bacterium]|nr:tetratricopeptide repeat protein [Xanthobacteraceae bacterium]
MTVRKDGSPLRGTLAFTGRLAAMKRAEAFDLVRKHGGTPSRGLSKKTDALVVGGLGWPLLPDGHVSKTLSHAQSSGVPIVSERRFLEWLGRALPCEETRAYSAQQIASLSGLPLEIVHQLALLGLLDPHDGLYPYRDVMAARQFSILFEAGVGLSVITSSLHAIRRWLPEAGLANLKLYPASGDAILVEQLKGRTDKTGQFVLPVDDVPMQPEDNPDALFESAQSAEEAGDPETAQRLYRRVMRMDPDDPAAAFNLGNLLRSTGKKVEAEAAYRAALKADAHFAEAWYNLADLLEAQGRAELAIDSLQRALKADPDYADAMFNLARLLHRHGKLLDAAVYWRRYLALDQTSEWAAHARRALKFCEIKIAHS